MREDPSLAKLDKVLVLDIWDAQFGRSRVYSIPKPMLDHSLICLDSGEIRTNTSKLFRFERWWLEYDEIYDLIQMNWSLQSGEEMLLTFFAPNCEDCDGSWQDGIGGFVDLQESGRRSCCKGLKPSKKERSSLIS